MNFMRKYVGFMLSIAYFTISSCTKTCPSGFEGKDCNIESIQKFIGGWAGQELCGIGNNNYNIQIGTSLNGPDRMVLYNLYDNGNPELAVTAKIKNTKFTIDSQSAGANFWILGSGSVNDNTITIRYTIGDGLHTDSCTFTGIKQ